MCLEDRRHEIANVRLGNCCRRIRPQLRVSTKYRSALGRSCAAQLRAAALQGPWSGVGGRRAVQDGTTGGKQTVLREWGDLHASPAGRCLPIASEDRSATHKAEDPFRIRSSASWLTTSPSSTASLTSSAATSTAASD